MIQTISIVVPAFNEESYLPLCLDSLKHQDYTGRYEIIVVDNGSTDGSNLVALNHGAKIIFCEQKGVLYARQAGAEAAAGDIIVQADADTIYPNNWLTRISEHFESHPKTAGLAGTYIYLDPPFWANIEYFLRYLVNLLSLIFLGNASLISGANFAFRVEAFQKARGYSAHCFNPDQWGLAHRLSKFGKIYYDRSLYVKTSARRIKKPFRMFLFDMLVNISRAVVYFMRFILNKIKYGEVKLIQPKKLLKYVALMSIFIIIAMSLYGYYVPNSQVFGKVYAASQTKQKVIAITFDDGPNEPYTSEILDILRNNDIKATFFLIGNNVDQYPEIVRRIVAEGNIVGNHTYNHNPNHALMDETKNDITKAEEAIYNATGLKPHLYRPPHGKKSPWELESLKDLGLIEVTWSAEANDQHEIIYFGKPTPAEYAEKIVHEAGQGRVILLHDGYGTIHDNIKSDKSLTVEALPIIISELQKQGYGFVTVPELFNVKAYK